MSFFVLSVTAPGVDHTRLVVGCEGPAEIATHTLRNAGYNVDVAVEETAPQRDQNEVERAQQFMALVFQPIGGNA